MTARLVNRPLGNNTEHVELPPELGGVWGGGNPRYVRWDLRDHAGTITPALRRKKIDMHTGEVFVQPSRLELCGRAQVDPERGVPVGVVVPADGSSIETGVMGNLMRCGLIWACASCSANIREGRAREIDTAVRRLRDQGGDAVMVTLTVPHHRRQGLKGLLDAVAQHFRKSIIGTPAYRGKGKGSNRYGGEVQEFGVVGTIRSLEVTYGGNGWHPHLHVLVLTDRPLEEWERTSLAERWSKRWNRAAEKSGLGSIHPVHGVKVTGGYAAYIAKVQEGGSFDELPALPGRELARMDAKSGRNGSVTPFQLVAIHRADADEEAAELWREYVDATRGRQAITWSRGLKAELLPDDDELSDEELAAALAETTVWVATVHSADWTLLIGASTWHHVEMMEALRRFGPRGLYRLLDSWGVGYSIPPGVTADLLEAWD